MVTARPQAMLIERYPPCDWPLRTTWATTALPNTMRTKVPRNSAAASRAVPRSMGPPFVGGGSLDPRRAFLKGRARSAGDGTGRDGELARRAVGGEGQRAPPEERVGAGPEIRSKTEEA